MQIPREVRQKTEQSEVLIPPGRYLVAILEMCERDEDVALRYQFIDGENRSMNGSISVETFPKSLAALPKLDCILKRFGLIPRNAQATNEDPDYDLDDLVGAMIVVDIAQQERESKKGNKFTVSQWVWGSGWKPDDPRVADFMRDRKIPGRATPLAPNQAATVPVHVAAPASYDDV